MFAKFVLIDGLTKRALHVKIQPWLELDNSYSSGSSCILHASLCHCNSHNTRVNVNRPYTIIIIMVMPGQLFDITFYTNYIHYSAVRTGIGKPLTISPG